MAREQDKQKQSICENRKSRHQYSFMYTLEAGLVLNGVEVKACRQGTVSLAQAFIRVIQGEAQLLNGHISSVGHNPYYQHEPTRSRKLLLHRREIMKMNTALQEKGCTAVPVEMYFSPQGRVKLLFAVAKGKNTVDKRLTLKAREADREVARALRQRHR